MFPELRMFDGTFERTDLLALLDILDGAQRIVLDLRPSGDPCTVRAFINGLAVTVTLRPWWARGCHTIRLPADRLGTLREQLHATDAQLVWVHLQADHLEVKPAGMWAK